MNHFYLGIDFGTSGARAIAINALAQIQAQATYPYPPAAAPQWPLSWKTALLTLIKQIAQAVPGEIKSIVINGTSATVLLCDGTGTPLTEPLFYNDGRGATVLPMLQAIAPPGHTVLSATSSLAKLLWWQQHPSCQREFQQARFFLHQADWLAFLLHGQLGISDYHNSLKLGYDVEQLAYPAWLLELSITALLPQVLAPGTPVQRVQPAIANELGLSDDCCICTGTTDSIAAFLASGATAPGEAVTSLGSTLVLKLLSPVRLEDAAAGIYSHRLGDLWLVGGASNTGGAVLQQFFTPAELIDYSLQIQPEQPSSLDYYPLLQPGERFPINDPHLLPRLSPRPADPVAFLHGLLESMARIEAIGYQCLQELGAPQLTRVYTAGGGATNEAWTHIRARHLQVPVLPSPQTEAAYGSALLALKAGSSLPQG